MREILCFAVTCILFTNLGWSQNRRLPIIAHTVDRGDYFYIPGSALADSVNGIVYQDKTLRKVPSNNRPIELQWHSVCTDGAYIITVTPEQVFFSSRHDNPNPNALFWVIPIDRERYENIRQGLVQRLPKNFIALSNEPVPAGLLRDKSRIVYQDKVSDFPSIPKEWTNAQFTACKAQMRSKLTEYFALLNSYNPNLSEPLICPATDSYKFFSTLEEEIRDWLPVEIKKK